MNSPRKILQRNLSHRTVAVTLCSRFDSASHLRAVVARRIYSVRLLINALTLRHHNDEEEMKGRGRLAIRSGGMKSAEPIPRRQRHRGHPTLAHAHMLMHRWLAELKDGLPSEAFE
jgi:hypothetical protein